jgi:hypothetical protein
VVPVMIEHLQSQLASSVDVWVCRNCFGGLA